MERSIGGRNARKIQVTDDAGILEVSGGGDYVETYVVVARSFIEGWAAVTASISTTRGEPDKKRPCLAVRWFETEGSTDFPTSQGNSSWFCLPSIMSDAVLQALVADPITLHWVREFLNQKISGEELAEQLKTPLLKRIILSIGDLYLADMCVQQILHRELYSSSDIRELELLECLLAALVVSYARPFSHNKGEPHVASQLPHEYLEVLSPEQRRLHNSLKTLRNQAYAHSDPEAVNAILQSFVTSKGLTGSVVSSPRSKHIKWIESKQHVEKIGELIACLQKDLKHKRDYMLFDFRQQKARSRPPDPARRT